MASRSEVTHEARLTKRGLPARSAARSKRPSDEGCWGRSGFGPLRNVCASRGAQVRPRHVWLFLFLKYLAVEFLGHKKCLT